MPKLTDEEVGQLLRETFADKESLIDQLPEATSTPARRKAPALLAAAAVLVLVAGVAVATGLKSGPDAQPVAQSPSPGKTGPTLEAQAKNYQPDTGVLAGVAVAELAKWERPDGGWPVVKVLNASYSQASSPTEAAGKGTPLSKQEQAAIARSAGVPIEWVDSRPTGPDVCDKADGTPYVTLGPVVFNKSRSSATIGMSIWRGCMDAQWLTYRLVPDATQYSGAGESGDRWAVAGTVGPVAVS
ncbi:hypothetical protein [Kribbella sp. NPDC051718]|uniref:hypothetical protein n=1 Tax=Kribbella sp. NPDC051718 TaxID=3155168 RepID=UPI0034169B82